MKFTAKTLFDGWSELTGVDGASKPDRLPSFDPTKVVAAVNATFRGDKPGPRPGLRRIAISYGGDTVLKGDVDAGRWQDATVYRRSGSPSPGQSEIIVSKGGRLFRFDLKASTAICTEISIRANKITTVEFTAPATGEEVDITVTSTENMTPGATIRVGSAAYQIVSLTSTVITASNISDTEDTVHAIGTVIEHFDLNPGKFFKAWMAQGHKWLAVNDGESTPIIYDGASTRRSRPLAGELPPGRQIAYGLGRFWFAGVDGVSYYGSDLSGGSSGTPEEKLKDSILKMTENNRIAAGGSFQVPTEQGQIRAMKFPALKDTSLGQGPLQVFTDYGVFSVNCPLKRDDWTEVEDPLATQAALQNGATGHDAVTVANSDLFFRSNDGIRSLVLTREEDSGAWGRTPISREMSYILDSDTETLLENASAVVFQNRLISTCTPLRTDRGIVFKGMAVMDFDPLGTMAKKQSPRWEGLWTGLHIFKIVVGKFDGQDRCLLFCQNYLNELEIYELTKDARFDRNSGTSKVPIRWSFETSGIAFRAEGKTGSGAYGMKQLEAGEMHYSNLVGRVVFRTFYKPDGHACWVPWWSWTDCAEDMNCRVDPATGCLNITNYRPQYRSPVGLPKPGDDVNPATKRRYRSFFTVQMRVEVDGCVELDRILLAASPMEVPEFAEHQPYYTPEVREGGYPGQVPEDPGDDVMRLLTGQPILTQDGQYMHIQPVEEE